MKRQVVSIQLLRGFAALMVVVAHVIEHPLRTLPDPLVITGRFGVEIFFVISGFIIAFVAGRTRFDVGDFAIRRVFRVVPLYWLCTFFVVALTLVAPSVFKRTVFDGEHLLRSLLFIPSAPAANPDDWRPIFKLGWTLNYEMFFYAVMACLFWCRSSLQRAVILTGIMACFVAGSFVVESRGSVLAFYANLNLLPFVCGVWLAELGSRGVFDRPRSAVVGLFAAAACATTLLLYVQDFESLRGLAGHTIMTAAAVMIVTTGLLAERWCGDRPMLGLRAVGDASYSLYLTHMFVVGAAWFVMDKLGVHGIAAFAGGLATVLVAVGVSLVSFRVVEEPFNRLGRRVGRAVANRGGATALDHAPHALPLAAAEDAGRRS